MFRRIQKELDDILKYSIDGEHGIVFLGPAALDDKDAYVSSIVDINRFVYKWKALLKGPVGSPYEGGLFELDIDLRGYPFTPPQIKFKTKIYHPNINDQGSIGLSSKVWSPAYVIQSYILIISSYLSEPDIGDNCVLEPVISQIYQTDKALYFKTAKEWTEKYATPSKQVKQVPAPTNITIQQIFSLFHLIELKYFIYSLLASIIFTILLTQLLSYYIHPKCLEIFLLINSFSSYHSNSLSSSSILFNISLWIAIELYEMIKLFPNISNNQSFIISLPIICLLCGGIMITAITEQRERNKFYRKNNPLNPNPSTVYNISNSSKSTSQSSSKSTVETKNMCSMFGDLSKLALTAAGYCTGSAVIGTLLLPIIVYYPIKWYLNNKIKQFQKYVALTRANMNRKVINFWNDIQEFMMCLVEYIREKKLVSLMVRTLVIGFGVWIGITMTSLMIAPYYIPKHHYQTLSVQQNISYLWWFVYASSMHKTIKLYIFSAIVTIPLNMYLFVLINEDAEGGMYLLMEIGVLSIFYLLSQMIVMCIMHKE
eukprot:214026_1